MNLSSISEALPIPSEQKNDTLVIDDLVVQMLDDSTVLVDGHSRYVSLPRKFEFHSEIQVYSILVPFILQALDGDLRL